MKRPIVKFIFMVAYAGYCADNQYPINYQIPRNQSMQTQTVSSASSLVDKSKIILQAKIMDSRPGGWMEKPDKGTKNRTVDLVLRIDKILKGEGPKTPFSLSTTASQAERIISRRFAVQGIWSEKDLNPGKEYVIFSSVAFPATDLLSDPVAETKLLDVRAWEEAGPNTILATEALRNNQSLKVLLEAAANNTPRLNDIFVTFAAQRLNEAIFGNWDTFEKWALLQENPDLPLTARVMMLTALEDRFTIADSGPIQFYGRAVVSMFRILRLDGTQALQTNILTVAIPSLVGIDGGVRFKSSSEIFSHYKDEQAASIGWLKTFPEKHTAQRVLDWILAIK